MYIPQTLEEVSLGVYERREKGNPLSAVLGTYYESEAVAILQNDYVHYNGLRKYLAGYLPQLLNYYRKTTAVGGGSPKLECLLLQADEINIVDGFAEIYKKNDALFRTIYYVENKVHIEYLSRPLAQPFKVPADAHSCVTFVHFLEHAANWENVCAWIENQENDIVIYGPNIAAATDSNWFHFRPADHNVFFTIDAVTDIGKHCGYFIDSLSYSDDMLVWMRRPDNIRDVSVFSRQTVSLREELLSVVYCLLQEIGQMRSASLEAVKLLRSGNLQNGREIISQKIIPRRKQINELFSPINSQYDFFSPLQNKIINADVRSFNNHFDKLDQLAAGECFPEIEYFLRHDLVAVTEMQLLLLNKMRKALIESGHPALEEKINRETEDIIYE